MKNKLLPIALLALATACTLFAATLTITIPANDVSRVQEAFGSMLGLGRPASQAEVQNAVHQWIVTVTHDYERRKHTATYSPPPMEMQPTPAATITPTPGKK